MEGIVGVFNSRTDAEGALRDLRLKVNQDAIIMLTPETSPEQVSEVPTT